MKVHLKNVGVSLLVVSGVLFTTNCIALGSDDTSANASGSPSVAHQVKVTVSDATITTKIKAKYAQNTILKMLDINVTTNHAVVNLAGVVDTDMQYEQAVTIAESTDGVSDVNADKLSVKDSAQPITDVYITAKVRGGLIKNQILGENVKNWPINIETKNGKVYVSGKVDSESQKNNILNIINSTSGVNSIVDQIQVS